VNGCVGSCALHSAQHSQQRIDKVCARRTLEAAFAGVKANDGAPRAAGIDPPVFVSRDTQGDAHETIA
jgi:hypothetical protein